MTQIHPITGPSRAPASGGPAKQLVVMLHGVGADGNDLIGLAPHWQQLLPDAAFVSPHAPEPCEMSPMGHQWFSLGRYDPNMMRRDPAHTAEVYGAMRQGADGVAPLLNAFIDAELASHGLADDKLALVGFSQGTMMSLHVGLRRERSPACILGFSGSLLGADRLADEIRQKPPVMLIHGDADDVVPVQALLDATSGLGAAGVTAQWHISNGVGHGIAPDGLELGGRFLSVNLPQAA